MYMKVKIFFYIFLVNNKYSISFPYLASEKLKFSFIKWVKKVRGLNFEVCCWEIQEKVERYPKKQPIRKRKRAAQA